MGQYMCLFTELILTELTYEAKSEESRFQGLHQKIFTLMLETLIRHLFADISYSGRDWFTP